jgi:hypothetical protein
VTPTAASSGTLTVDVAAGAASDAAGNASLAPPQYSQAYDTQAPGVSDVRSVNVDGTYGAGALVTLTVRFTEPVVVSTAGGVPSLELETGDSNRLATYYAGSGTDTLTFTYIAQTGDSTADLDVASTTALALNGGTIRDRAGNNAVLTLPAPGAPGSLAANANLVINGATPTSLLISTGTPNVSEGSSISVSLSSDTLAAGDILHWTFSGAGINATDFTPSGLSGSISLGSDKRAAFSRVISLDGVAEGDELLTLGFYADAGLTQLLGQAQFTIRDLMPSGLGGATDGRDLLTGTSADDVITGVPNGSVLHGRGSYDTLTGNGGNDLFVMGTSAVVYYNDDLPTTAGASDLAAITDFAAGDRIQLRGSAVDYRLSSGRLAGSSGTLLHWQAAAGAGSTDEIIGFLQGVDLGTLSLTNSDQFTYV